MGAGMPQGGRGGGDSEHQGWRPQGGADSITHNQERVIPGDIAAKYLRNHEAGTVLTSDGRQAMFRKEAVGDFGFGYGESPLDGDGDVEIRLRFETPDLQATGIPLDDVSGEAEFSGTAEIVAAPASGSEVVLGTYNSGSSTWTPTPDGRRWLKDRTLENGTSDKGSQGRTR